MPRAHWGRSQNSPKRSSLHGLEVNKSDRDLWGCAFHPWLCSAGEGSSVAMSCGVGHRCGSDLALLWLWHRPAAVAPIWPLAWELSYATGVPLKKKKNVLWKGIAWVGEKRAQICSQNRVNQGQRTWGGELRLLPGSLRHIFTILSKGSQKWTVFYGFTSRAAPRGGVISILITMAQI